MDLCLVSSCVHYLGGLGSWAEGGSGRDVAGTTGFLELHSRQVRPGLEISVALWGCPGGPTRPFCIHRSSPPIHQPTSRHSFRRYRRSQEPSSPLLACSAIYEHHQVTDTRILSIRPPALRGPLCALNWRIHAQLQPIVPSDRARARLRGIAWPYLVARAETASRWPRESCAGFPFISNPGVRRQAPSPGSTLAD
ncbi:hypothetical protein B0J18DRAFT_239569 [Chaetomium sp. MPI-SDFR-AT-0129]|nr:hypothetical protein B0J18DRAFT_239569 [Chaetomium sp. MPI-SDFR-AT-0129]